jgi:EAL domain-containing protein (putative c-di-GMP-specific phosphodiesterase class I)
MGVAIDDFGTGNASIDYLARLPASELKIDRSFVSAMDDDPLSAALVRTAIDLARNLGLSVVAEGVETERSLAQVAELGCDQAQGYVIARPLPGAQLAAMLAHPTAQRGAPTSASRPRQSISRRLETRRPAGRDA